MTGAKNYTVTPATIADTPVKIVTYEIEGRYYCKVENENPGATIARAEADSNKEAKRVALAKAESRLAN